MTETIELTLQRLTDGELDPSAQQRLWQEAETNPALWREIALSLVEHRELQSALGALVQASPATATLRPSPANPKPSITRRLAIAASLIATLSLGFLLGTAFTPSPHPQTHTSGIVSSGTAPTHRVTDTLSSTDNAPYRLLIPVNQEAADADTPEAADDPSAAPMLNLPAYDEATWEAGPMAAAEQGWALAWQTHVLSAQLEDGRRFVAPVTTPGLYYQGQ